MVWPRVKEGRGGYHQEDVKHASARKEKKGEAQEKMVGQYQGGHERVQDDGRHGTRSKCVAHEDKGRPIATWRRPLGEKVRKSENNIKFAHTRLQSEVPLKKLPTSHFILKIVSYIKYSRKLFLRHMQSRVNALIHILCTPLIIYKSLVYHIHLIFTQILVFLFSATPHDLCMLLLIDIAHNTIALLS